MTTHFFSSPSSSVPSSSPSPPSSVMPSSVPTLDALVPLELDEERLEDAALLDDPTLLLEPALLLLPVAAPTVFWNTVSAGKDSPCRPSACAACV